MQGILTSKVVARVEGLGVHAMHGLWAESMGCMEC